MITIECTWCEAELLLDNLDADRVDCPDCLVSMEFAHDPEPLSIAA